MTTSLAVRLIGERTQYTLAADCCFEGVGVHTGALTQVCVKPAPEGTGIRFVRVDTGCEIAAIPSNVSDTRRCTTLSCGADSVSTVEHLLSAMSVLKIDNALVEINGPEMPMLDGSAQPFLSALSAAGTVEQAAKRPVFAVTEPLTIELNGARMSVSPDTALRISYKMHYPGSPLLQNLSGSFAIDVECFREHIAPARTFALLSEVQALRDAGLIQGGSLDCAVVIDGDHVVNPDGLRFEGEMVRHKILDVVGDFGLLGVDLQAHIQVERGGHELNCAMVKALAAECSQELVHGR